MNASAAAGKASSASLAAWSQRGVPRWAILFRLASSSRAKAAESFAGLRWHHSYSYSQWKDKGMSFVGYSDNLGLLIGQKNSHRYATGLDCEFDQWRVGLGFSLGLRYLFK